MSQFETHRNVLHALKWKSVKKKEGKRVKILNPLKFPSFLKPLILFLFQLKSGEIISIGAKGTGNSMMLLSLSIGL